MKLPLGLDNTAKGKCYLLFMAPFSAHICSENSRLKCIIGDRHGTVVVLLHVAVVMRKNNFPFMIVVLGAENVFHTWT